jgi:Thiamine biosynthesis ATP pyrophosphatase
MEHVILVRYGEIALKGLNRNYFIELLAKNIRTTLRSVPSAKVKKIQGRLIVNVSDEDLNRAMERVQKVFGIVSISPAIVIDSDITAIEENAIEQVRSAQDIKTFKITAKRGDKTFPIKSPDLCCRLGEVVLDNVTGITVDIHSPDLNLVGGSSRTDLYVSSVYCLQRRFAGRLQRQRGTFIIRRHR